MKSKTESEVKGSADSKEHLNFLTKLRSKLITRIPVLNRYNTAINVSIMLSVTALILAFTLMIAVNKLAHQPTTTIVTPPSFTEQISMRGNQISESYQTSWAIFVAEQIGNINASRMDLTLKVIRKMIPAQWWDTVLQQMKNQIARLRIRKIEEKFAATNVIFDPKTKVVWVVGEKETKSIRTGDSNSELWTFEVKIVSQNGFPKITHLKQYAGNPNTHSRSRVIQKEGDNMAVKDDLNADSEPSQKSNQKVKSGNK